MSKVDRRLITEIQQRSQRARDEGMTHQELALQRYQVSIELKQTLIPRNGLTRAETLNDLKRQAQSHQASMVKMLKSMGVASFKVLPLSNSIKTYLTAEQIDEIAKHPDVKIIRFVKPEIVIT